MSDTTGPDILERLSQRISSAYFNVGPKLTMTDVAEVLAEVRTLRDDVTRLREENQRLQAMAFRPKSTHETGCLCIQCQPF